MSAKKKPAHKSTKKPAADEMVAKVLEGNTRAIARMMSRAEAGFRESRNAMTEIYRHAGNAHVIGITGIPGSGKSTLVHALALAFRGSGRRVGIVAVDPSSPFSGGAILGDRVRMGDLATDDGTFVRSMATCGALGGLARASLDTVDILDAAGFEVVMVETVGIGQDEVDIAEAAHTVVVVSAPGLGDEVQAIKAGVLEIADIHVVSKADKSDSHEVAANLQSMLGLGLNGKDRSGWQVVVLLTSAQENFGIAELAARIDEHFQHLKDTGEFSHRRRRILETRIVKTVEDIVRSRIIADREQHLDALLDRAESGDIDPQDAVQQLIQNLKI